MTTHRVCARAEFVGTAPAGRRIAIRTRPAVIATIMLATACSTAPSVTPSASVEPLPSLTGSSAPAPTSTGNPPPSPTADAASTILFAAADGLRVRAQPSADAEERATLRAGQLMGVVSGPSAVDDMHWYEIRIGPGDLRGWVAAGPAGAWLREVRNGGITFGCDSCASDNDPATISDPPATVIADADDQSELIALAFATTSHAWSPDGEYLAVNFAGMDTTTVAVLDADGGNSRDLGWGYVPVWSPDGERLAGLRSPGPGGISTDQTAAIVLIDVGTWTTTEVPIPGFRAVGGLSWSPDGARLAIVGFHCPQCLPDEPILGDPPMAIYTVRPDGSGLEQLTRSTTDGLPTWSPDGTQLLFMRYDLSGERPTQALVVPSAGGEPTPLFDGQAIHGAPAWSPDGTRLAAGTADGLIVTDGDGDNASLLAPAAGSGVGEVRWSPDGREIAYVLVDAVWIVPLDGSGSPRRISPEGTYAGIVSWQPILAELP